MPTYEPLAEILRPSDLVDFVGQNHLLESDKPIGKALADKQLHSMILWGPSGVGKTTLARIICSQMGAHFEQMSAVLDGLKELRNVIEHAELYKQHNKNTILFVDEIHRFNKAQQDAFLSHIESGLITLIGATIDNSDGDARRLINIIEQLSEKSKATLNKKDIAKTLQGKVGNFDKGGDIYYQQLSAFHKSVRGSSPDGALYWMARMIVSGCDPKVIARRLLAIASEDIGNADPRALQITLNAWDVYERLGDKEGNRAIAHAAVFCACAPKSNAVHSAFNQAIQAAKDTGDLGVPVHLRNATTKLLEELGHGKGYRSAHNEPGGFSQGQTYFPEEMGEQIYYEPTDRGLEIKIKEKLKQLRADL